MTRHLHRDRSGSFRTERTTRARIARRCRVDVVAVAASLIAWQASGAQSIVRHTPDFATAQPTLRATPLARGSMVQIDGRLDDAIWKSADSIADLTQLEPQQGSAPSGRTVIRVLAGTDVIIIGVRADDAMPDALVSFARERDAVLTNEDHVKIVLDTYRDGRFGYVFAINPNGARYDALVAGQGETENANWDAAWEAVTARTPTGWSAEIRIPVRSLQFRAGLRAWGLNVQRRAQRTQETDRWASPDRNFKVTQTFRAGELTEIPDFALGLGLSVRPALVSGFGIAAPAAPMVGTTAASLDVTQTLGANTLASLTVNTDFAETEVDTRRTNLTRFPLIFPEKRTFFLQGADIFDFGIGLGDDVRPFFSRRIGLLGGDEVPIRAGAKVSGRAGQTNFGTLVVRTGQGDAFSRDTLSTAATLGVLRLKRNVLRESSIGMIATIGDPQQRGGAWTGGVDATYQTSRFRRNRNLLVGGWALQTARSGLTGQRSAYGATVDYPNDLWDLNATYKNLGTDFDPSIGFVPRAGVQILNLSAVFQPRPQGRVMGLRVRQMFNEFFGTVVAGQDGRWQSYRSFFAPVNWRLESGDRFEGNIVPTGEHLLAPFEIASGVTIPPGTYHWNRYRLEGGLAAKRRLSGQGTWWFGDFYGGRLDEMILTAAWKPTSLFIMELTATRNVGRLPQGSFTQNLIGTRVRLNVSPDLQLNSYVQYDNESDSFGSNTRVRWTFSPLGDLFVVYNHNLRHDIDPATGLPVPSTLVADPTQRVATRWGLASSQLIVKVQYAVRR